MMINAVKKNNLPLSVLNLLIIFNLISLNIIIVSMLFHLRSKYFLSLLNSLLSTSAIVLHDPYKALLTLQGPDLGLCLNFYT